MLSPSGVSTYPSWSTQILIWSSTAGGSLNDAWMTTAPADFAVTTPAGLSGPAATPKEVGLDGPLVSLPVNPMPGCGEALPASSVTVAVTVIPSSGFGVSFKPEASTGTTTVALVPVSLPGTGGVVCSPSLI